MAISYRRERLDRGIKARSDDIFVLSSYGETLYLVLPRIIPIVGILLIPLLKETLGMYWEKVLVITCIISLLSLSWDLLMSVGLVSLGQALFFGAGAYFAGFLNKSFNWSPFLTIPIATLGGGAFCTVLLVPVLRLRGIYFSLITLVLPILFMRVIEASKIFGGEEGIVAITPFPSIWIELYVPGIALLLCLFGLRRLINTDYGIVLRGIRDNDRAVMARGINVYWYKAQVVFIASAIGAFGGAFLTHYYQFAGTSGLGLDYSILPLTCVIVGGSGNFAGAVLGTFILVPLVEILRAFGPLRVVFYSLILLAFVVALPGGIFDYLQRKYHQFERLVSVEVGK